MDREGRNVIGKWGGGERWERVEWGEGCFFAVGGGIRVMGRG